MKDLVITRRMMLRDESRSILSKKRKQLLTVGVLFAVLNKGIRK
ncbi:hypothetical protein [Vallitalea longa]|nr:hypothetical protein [Vallitalea longa]